MALEVTFNRFLQLKTNIKDLAARAPQHQLIRLKRIKKKYERNMARQNALPVELPRINWEYYRENLGAKHDAFITEFEQKYRAFKIPLPQHEFTAKYDNLKKEYMVDVKKYNDESDCRIKCYDDARQLYKSLMPFEQMTMEDYCKLFTNEAPDYINRPTFWPHTPEDQMGYVKPKNVPPKKEPPVHDRKVKIEVPPKDVPARAKGKVSKATEQPKTPNPGK